MKTSAMISDFENGNVHLCCVESTPAAEVDLPSVRSADAHIRGGVALAPKHRKSFNYSLARQVSASALATRSDVGVRAPFVSGWRPFLILRFVRMGLRFI